MEARRPLSNSMRPEARGHAATTIGARRRIPAPGKDHQQQQTRINGDSRQYSNRIARELDDFVPGENSASAAKSSAKGSHRRDAMRSIPLPNHHGNALVDGVRPGSDRIKNTIWNLWSCKPHRWSTASAAFTIIFASASPTAANIRCFYCMPETGVEFVERREILSFEEIERFARIAVGLGITKLRVTGGEPLVRRGLPVLIRRLAAIPGVRDLALTTNGVLLEALAGPLYEAGLRRLNVHLDTLDRGRFRQIARRDDLDKVLAGLEAARRLGYTTISLNVSQSRT